MASEIKVGRTGQTPDCLKPPEMQCVKCWHRWKPGQNFRDMPKCPECGSTWLVSVESLNMGLRKEHEHKLPWWTPIVGSCVNLLLMALWAPPPNQS